MLAVSAGLAYKSHAHREDGSGLPHGPRRPPSRGRLNAAHSAERTHRSAPHAYRRPAGGRTAGRAGRLRRRGGGAGPRRARRPARRRRPGSPAAPPPARPHRRRPQTGSAGGRRPRRPRARPRGAAARPAPPPELFRTGESPYVQLADVQAPVPERAISTFPHTPAWLDKVSSCNWATQAALGAAHQPSVPDRQPCTAGRQAGIGLYCHKAMPAPGWGWPARLRWLRWRAPAPAQAAPARAAARAQPYLNSSCVAIVKV